MNKILSFSSKVCVNPVPLDASVGGAGQPSAEGEEWPAVPDGGGSGGHERADEETQSRGCPGNNLPDASVGSSENHRERYFENPFVINTQSYSSMQDPTLKRSETDHDRDKKKSYVIPFDCLYWFNDI